MKKIAVVVVLSIAGFAAFHVYRAALPRDDVTYVLAPVEKGQLQETVSATGVVHAVATVSVGSQLSGRIESVSADFNDHVRAGQPLAHLAKQRFEARVDGARAALERARAQVQIRAAGVERATSALAHEEAQLDVLAARIERVRSANEEAGKSYQRSSALVAKGVVSEEDIDQARSTYAKAGADLRAVQAEHAAQIRRIEMVRAELMQAEAELLDAQAQVPQEQAALELARAELEQTIIRSPIDGIVLERLIEPGQTVAASLEAPRLFTIARDLQQMEIHTEINEADIGRIIVGQRAIFTVDAYPDRVFEGQVAQIRLFPDSRNNVVTYKTLIASVNPDRVLLPGMTAAVRVVVMESEEVKKIPLSALRYRPAEGFLPTASLAADGVSREGTVWVLDDEGKPSPVTVTLGLRDLQSLELTGGPLELGDEVIVNEIAPDKKSGLFGIRIGF